YIDPAITRYLVELVHATRNTGKSLGRFAPFIEYGASPLASIPFTTAVRALALIRSRNYCLPEDIKDLPPRVMAHRIQLNFAAAATTSSPTTSWTSPPAFWPTGYRSTAAPPQRTSRAPRSAMPASWPCPPPDRRRRCLSRSIASRRG